MFLRTGEVCVDTCILNRPSDWTNTKKRGMGVLCLLEGGIW